MDVTKINAAIDTAHQELNTVIDAEVKAKSFVALRTLGLAANALSLAQTHLKKAVKQTTPKVAPVAAAPVAEAGKKGK